MTKLGNGLGLWFNQGGGGTVIADGAGQSFNGTDQYAYIADNGALDINQATTDFCVGLTIVTGSDITTLQVVGSKYNNLSGTYYFYITGGHIYFSAIAGNTVTPIDNITLAINTKYFILARIDITNSKVYFYIDKVLQNSDGSSFIGSFATLANTVDLVLGANDNGASYANFFNGLLQDCRIYHKDVSSSANQTSWINGEQLGDEKAWWNLPTLTGFGGTSYDLTGVNL